MIHSSTRYGRINYSPRHGGSRPAANSHSMHLPLPITVRSWRSSWLGKYFGLGAADLQGAYDAGLTTTTFSPQALSWLSTCSPLSSYIFRPFILFRHKTTSHSTLKQSPKQRLHTKHTTKHTTPHLRIGRANITISVDRLYYYNNTYIKSSP
mgnify:CR=1 FL=1